MTNRSPGRLEFSFPSQSTILGIKGEDVEDLLTRATGGSEKDRVIYYHWTGESPAG